MNEPHDARKDHESEDDEATASKTFCEFMGFDEHDVSPFWYALAELLRASDDVALAFASQTCRATPRYKLWNIRKVEALRSRRAIAARMGVPWTGLDPDEVLAAGIADSDG